METEAPREPLGPKQTPPETLVDTPAAVPRAVLVGYKGRESENGEQYIVLTFALAGGLHPLKLVVRGKEWVLTNLASQLGKDALGTLRQLRNLNVLRMQDLTSRLPGLTSMDGVVMRGGFDGCSETAVKLLTPKAGGKSRVLCVVTAGSLSLLDHFKVESTSSRRSVGSVLISSVASAKQTSTVLKYTIHVEVNSVGAERITPMTRSLLGQCVLLNRRRKLDSFSKIWPIAANRLVDSCCLTPYAIPAFAALLERPEPLRMLCCRPGSTRAVVVLTPDVLQEKNSGGLTLPVGHRCPFNFKARARASGAGSKSNESTHATGCAGRAASTTRSKKRSHEEVSALNPRSVFEVLKRHLRIVDSAVLRQVSQEIVALQSLTANAANKPPAATIT